jgi:AcrR family transcriptional regulator
VVDVPDPPWLRSRRARAAPRAPLSREAIVDAALKVVDRDGLDATSMRRVAEELGSAPSALYWHVRNKEELLQLVLDRVAGEIELPPRDPANWQEQLKQVAREMRRVLTRHRDVARVTLGSIPAGPNTLVVVEWMHALLREAGLPDRVVALVGDLAGLYVGAFAYEESLRVPALGDESASPEQLADYFRSLPPDAFPNLVRLADDLTAGGADERFEFAIELLVRGLEAMADEDGD